MVIEAVLGDLPGWSDCDDLRRFYEDVRKRLQEGQTAIAGDRLEIESVLNTVNTWFGRYLLTEAFRRLNGREQESARKQAMAANKWVVEQGKVIESAPKGHGKRIVDTPKAAPAKTKARKPVSEKTMSLFGDEG